mgnify:CR=1 FL=1|tara:strand:+ start:3147 stop:3425 length:279 start_codon:yes stop_codon:yes gene_type:complete
MSDAEAQELEIDVADNAETQEGIRKMMDQWAEGDLTSANDTFNALIGRKADDLVVQRKAEILPGIFNDPEMQKMGLEATPEDTEEEATDEEV